MRRGRIRLTPELAYLSRQERARACCHIGELLYRCAVKRFELLAIQDICDTSFGKALAVSEQVGAIGGAQRVVRIMRCEKDTVPRCDERADFAHHLALIAEVQTRGRLVEHDEPRLLSEGTSQ